MITTKRVEDWACDVVMIYCQHCTKEHDKMAVAAQKCGDTKMKTVMVPCSSKVEVPSLLKILERGVDAILVVACPQENCQFLIGSKRAEKRVEYARGLLKQINISPERLSITRKSGLSAEKMIKLLSDRAKAVRPLGPSPMKKAEKMIKLISGRAKAVRSLDPRPMKKGA